MNIKIAPSILTSDFLHLEDQVLKAVEAGANYIHVDVMDGHFVPNISFGSIIVEALKDISAQYNVPLDVHLMITNPDNFIEEFCRAGADILTVHVETCSHLNRTVQMIKGLGMKAGVTLNPATPISLLEEIIVDIDLVLIMSVNPGFGGQIFIPSTLHKIRRLHSLLQDSRLDHIELEVDGGISASNAREVVKAGATILVAGSSIFNKKSDISDNINAIRAACADLTKEKG